ncbi:MAG: hypothetical protein J0L75_15360 [Spirochaetes bacterium]|nr:hypothetical protein [Spirochaetota bacterium]
MVNVLLLSSYGTWPFFDQTPGQRGVWKGTRFTWDPQEGPFDWVVVLDELAAPVRVRVSPDRLAFFAWEPPSMKFYHDAFLRQFARVVGIQPRLRAHPGFSPGPLGMPWFVRKKYDEIPGEPCEKTIPRLSVITSNKAFSPAHRRRLQFCLRLKEVFKDRVDLFGRGIRDFDDKWSVLAPYPFTVAIENDRLPWWITEKLLDPYLALSFPLYFGAPEAEASFGPESLLRIDPGKPKESMRTIERVLSERDFYAARRPALLAARAKVLEVHQTFAVLEQNLTRWEGQSPRAAPVDLLLAPNPAKPPMLPRLLRRARNLF